MGRKTFEQLIRPDQVELETGAGLPDFVKEEFDAFPSLGAYSDTSMYLAYLECGI